MGNPKGTKVQRADVGSARGAQANAANANAFAEGLRSIFAELKKHAQPQLTATG
jgi:hypothetical protein